MLRPRLDMTTRHSIKLSLLTKAKPNNSLISKSSMTTTGSLIKTSSFNFSIATLMTNFTGVIQEPELLLLMMISQDIFTSRKTKPFQP